MSLKAFHFFFIVVSVLFSAYFATWCFNNDAEVSGQCIQILGYASAVAAVALFGYLIWFIKKSRNLQVMVLATLSLLSFASSKTAIACATCAGNPNHPMTRAANAGVWVLLMVISGVLVSFASLFIYWGVRSRKLERYGIPFKAPR